MNILNLILARLSQRRDAGQGLVEYGLILSLVAIVAILSLAFLGGNLNHMLSTIGHSV